jgi:hypothetical protein
VSFPVLRQGDGQARATGGIGRLVVEETILGGALFGFVPGVPAIVYGSPLARTSLESPAWRV